MIRGINPFGAGAVENKPGAFESVLIRKSVVREDKINPAVREFDAVRLNKRIAVVPREARLIGMKSFVDVLIARFPDGPDRKAVRRIIKVPGEESRIIPFMDGLDKLLRLTQPNCLIFRFPSQMRIGDCDVCIAHFQID